MITANDTVRIAGVEGLWTVSWIRSNGTVDLSRCVSRGRGSFRVSLMEEVAPERLTLARKGNREDDAVKELSDFLTSVGR